MPPNSPASGSTVVDLRWGRVWWTIWGVVTVLAVIAETLRWLDPEQRAAALSGWLSQGDWLPFLPWLLLAPLVHYGLASQNERQRDAPTTPKVSWLSQSAATDSSRWGVWGASLLIFVLGFGMSRWIEQFHFAGMPPAYHDEYSYLFQAETFLRGQFSAPGFERQPELFDQMHVLNEGRMASRYFPGVGAWLLPFVAWGDPWLGQQVAHGLCALLMFWIGRELGTNAIGVLAGVMFAFSPGLLLFSTLLLAHHPTLLGLLLFSWSFLRWSRTGEWQLALIAGAGLSFAMLCRPMTAAGFALPFGIVFAVWWLTGNWGPQQATDADTRDRMTLVMRSRCVLAMAVPLGMGFIVLGVMNRSITGSVFETPYQQYTDIYTPRHVYGFNNVVRGEEKLGPKVLDEYDRWAENLTPKLAARNVWTRTVQSLRWTWGIVPLLLCGGVAVCLGCSVDARWGLAIASMGSLHLAHVPYWFTGIMGWHYVLESSVWWILLAAAGCVWMCRYWDSVDQRRMQVWLAGLMLTAWGVNLVVVEPLWPGRLPEGVMEVSFARRRYAEFRQRIDELRDGQPAIVFVIPDPSDRSMDYVTNQAGLDGPVLRARLKDPGRLPEVVDLFPDRAVIVFDAKAGTFGKIRSAVQE